MGANTSLVDTPPVYQLILVLSFWYEVGKPSLVPSTSAKGWWVLPAMGYECNVRTSLG